MQSKDDWVKLNLGQHVPIRVLYTPNMLEALRKGVRCVV